MTERVGNVTRTRYEQIVAEARELIAQVTRALITLMSRRLTRKGPRTDSWTKKPVPAAI